MTNAAAPPTASSSWTLALLIVYALVSLIRRAEVPAGRPHPDRCRLIR
ncbi:MAG: hypothetical protein U0521_20375 [Anaerolineae bacterium]